MQLVLVKTVDFVLAGGTLIFRSKATIAVEFSPNHASIEVVALFQQLLEVPLLLLECADIQAGLPVL